MKHFLFFPIDYRKVGWTGVGRNRGRSKIKLWNFDSTAEIIAFPQRAKQKQAENLYSAEIFAFLLYYRVRSKNKWLTIEIAFICLLTIFNQFILLKWEEGRLELDE